MDLWESSFILEKNVTDQQIKKKTLTIYKARTSIL